MKQRITWGLILTFVTVFLFFLCAILFFKYILIWGKIDIYYKNFVNNDLLYDVVINYTGNSEELYCSIDGGDWKKN